MGIWSIRRFAGFAAVAIAAPLLAGCSSGGRVSYAAGVDRATPEKTYAFFKNAVRQGAYADEWSVFSPNFKRQMREAAGRDVDFALYATGRQTIATNNHADMAVLLQSTLTDVQYQGPNAALVTITGGGRTVRPRMVRLTTWELRVKGEDPFSDILQNPDVVRSAADGSIQISIPAAPHMAPLLKSIAPANIQSLQVESRWYVDDFGGLEEAVGTGSQAATPAPGTPPPTPATPPPPGGYGSPDG
jgi:hypothetical protein